MNTDKQKYSEVIKANIALHSKISEHYNTCEPHFYHWYIGQAALINDEKFSKEERFKHADVMDTILQRILHLSKHLFKYVGFIATK